MACYVNKSSGFKMYGFFKGMRYHTLTTVNNILYLKSSGFKMQGF